MPHVNIKHFPSLSKTQQAALGEKITAVITEVIGCSEDVVSVALQPVEKDDWYATVYQPEIINRKELLCKFPKY